MAKQAESAMLGSLEPKKASEERPHAGSLDSMLYKDSLKSGKKAACSSPTTASKKSSPGLLSRFKSGMSMDSTRSNSNSDSLHDQSSQSPSGWISSLTASFRPKRQQVASEPPPFSSSHPRVRPAERRSSDTVYGWSRTLPRNNCRACTGGWPRISSAVAVKRSPFIRGLEGTSQVSVPNSREETEPKIVDESLKLRRRCGGGDATSALETRKGMHGTCRGSK